MYACIILIKFRFFLIFQVAREPKTVFLRVVREELSLLMCSSRVGRPC